MVPPFISSASQGLVAGDLARRQILAELETWETRSAMFDLSPHTPP